MRHLTQSLALNPADAIALQKLQSQVDAAADYAAQVALAQRKWEAKNNALFGRIRLQLQRLNAGAQRCGYCEDSLGDEIEHIRPKNWFPDQVFRPENLLAACGPCNSPKGDAYAVVLPAGQVVAAVRNAQTGVQPPPAGQEAFLNPRYDDPADFLAIDLTGTFRIRPRLGLDIVGKARAEYTIRVLRLDMKDVLDDARKEAFQDFASRLKAYFLAEKQGATPLALAQMQAELLKKQHISVWREMQRQSKTALLPLFSLVPGADRW